MALPDLRQAPADAASGAGVSRRSPHVRLEVVQEKAQPVFDFSPGRCKNALEMAAATRKTLLPVGLALLVSVGAGAPDTSAADPQLLTEITDKVKLSFLHDAGEASQTAVIPPWQPAGWSGRGLERRHPFRVFESVRPRCVSRSVGR